MPPSAPTGSTDGDAEAGGEAEEAVAVEVVGGVVDDDQHDLTMPIGVSIEALTHVSCSSMPLLYGGAITSSFHDLLPGARCNPASVL